MIPSFKILVDGIDKTAIFNALLIDLSVTDKRGLEADSLTLTIDARRLNHLPRRGVKITLYLGYQSETLVHKGDFIVDGTSLSGPPDVMTIEASSANFHSEIKVAKDQSWDGDTLGAILDGLAQRNGLTGVIHPSFMERAAGHINQRRESDMNIITRLAERFDAIATIKSGRLVFMPVGGGETARGKTLPRLLITRQEGSRFSFGLSDRENEFTGVMTKWQDLEAGKTRSVLAGERKTLKTIKKTFATEAEAQDAAQALWQKIQRGTYTITVDQSPVNLTLSPDYPVQLNGFSPDIDGINWLCVQVSLTLNDQGLSASIELESAL